MAQKDQLAKAQDLTFTSYYDTPTAIEADEKTFWLIWRDKLSDDSLLELSQRGLNAEEVYEGRFPNTIYCYVYRVVR